MKFKLLFLMSTFIICAKISAQKKDSVSAIIKFNNSKIYTFFKVTDKYLYTIKQKGDSIVLYSYFKGSASGNILFWRTEINGNKYYVRDHNVIQTPELIKFKYRIDSIKQIEKENKNNLRYKELVTKFGVYATERIIKKEYWIGMTDEMARISLGVPDKNNTGKGSWGYHQQWFYRDKDLYLYFQNGKLTSWQD